MQQSSAVVYIASIIEEARNLYDDINALHKAPGQRCISVQHDHTGNGVCQIVIHYLLGKPTRSLVETVIKSKAEYKWDIWGNDFADQVRKEIRIEDKDQFLLAEVRRYLAKRHPEWDMTAVECSDLGCMRFYAQDFEY